MELCDYSPGYNQGMVKKPTRLYLVSSFWGEGGDNCLEVGVEDAELELRGPVGCRQTQ